MLFTQVLSTALITVTSLLPFVFT